MRNKFGLYYTWNIDALPKKKPTKAAVASLAKKLGKIESKAKTAIVLMIAEHEYENQYENDTPVYLVQKGADLEINLEQVPFQLFYMISKMASIG